MKFWTTYDKFWLNVERDMFKGDEQVALIPRWRFYFRFGFRMAIVLGFLEMIDILSRELNYSTVEILLKIATWLLLGFGFAIFLRFFVMRDYKYFLRKGWKSEKQDDKPS